ncbi:hypothetical protein [Tellurirhabdus rosea]|uniref:hypothetical protein n=1 Tax=Tellurirhabdus rosea TaxID=2674997 RepID=UPI00225BA933|nr:hypothetical protein [Tellurirhabdus rosea]
MKIPLLPPGRRYSFLLLAGLLMSLASCQDHGVPTQPQHGLRVVQFQLSAGRNLVFDDFFYDAQKRLARHVSFNPVTGRVLDTRLFYYDGNNRLVRIESLDENQIADERTLITYNTAGLPQTVAFYSLTAGSQTANLNSTHEYSYSSTGQMTGYTSRSASGDQRTEYQYTYTGKNITKITATEYRAGQSTPVSTLETVYTFDDKYNPYKTLFGNNLTAPYLQINENNILQISQNNSTIERTLTYNSEGLPTRFFTPNIVAPSTMDIKYEPY